MEILQQIQNELKVGKPRFNKFGNYHYRASEDIVEQLKPVLAKFDASLTITDQLIYEGGRFYIKATCTLTKDGAIIAQTSAYAREEDTKKGMDASQITGASSSYARKYALNGMLLLDDVQDSDATNTQTSVSDTKTIQQKTTEYLRNNEAAFEYFIQMEKYKNAKSVDMLSQVQLTEIGLILKKGNKI